MDPLTPRGGSLLGTRAEPEAEAPPSDGGHVRKNFLGSNPGSVALVSEDNASLQDAHGSHIHACPAAEFYCVL